MHIIFNILTLIMIGLCNLEILQMLIDFRKSDSDDIPTNLVPLLLNLSTTLDLKALDKLLFYEKEIHFYKEENKRRKVYLQIVKDKMSWQSHNKLQLVINDMSIYSTNINTFFQSFTTSKKRLSVLDFCKKIDTQENKVMNVRFQPVKNETVIKKQFLQKIDGVQVFKRFTFRCNKNIVNPCRLTFIKFHDQLKPPIYYHYEKDGNRNSLKKLDIDYDFDSDAEWILEDGESVNSETRSVDDSEMTEEWIDEDSVVVEKNVKTEIEYMDMPFKIYKSIGNEFCLSLLKSDIVKEELIDELKKRLETGVKENVIKMFGYEYRIKNSVVSKKVKEILAQEK